MGVWWKSTLIFNEINRYIQWRGWARARLQMCCQKTDRDEVRADTGQGHLKRMPEGQNIIIRVTTIGRYMWLEMLDIDSKAITEI